MLKHQFSGSASVTKAPAESQVPIKILKVIGITREKEIFFFVLPRGRDLFTVNKHGVRNNFLQFTEIRLVSRLWVSQF